MRVWNLDLVNAYLKHGKQAPLFKKICKLSNALIPYRLNGIKMERHIPRYIPLRGKPQPWKVLERPRPPHKDPVTWMLENYDKMEED